MTLLLACANKIIGISYLLESFSDIFDISNSVDIDPCTAIYKQ